MKFFENFDQNRNISKFLSKSKFFGIFEHFVQNEIFRKFHPNGNFLRNFRKFLMKSKFIRNLTKLEIV